MAKKTRWQFRYIGHEPVTSAFTKIVRKGKTIQTDGGLEPGDVVVVDDLDTAIWLRSNTGFLEEESPTHHETTHKPAKKKAPAKKAPAHAPKKKAPASAG